jgi:hypothetical protein
MPDFGKAPEPVHTTLLLAILLPVLLTLSGCGSGGEDAETARAEVERPGPRPEAEERLEVPPPPFSPGIYPCSACHEMIPPNPARRELTFHTEIVLSHDEEHRWCLDCHDSQDRDWLHLASGELVSFEESYRLCGQCHGEKYRDWRAGVHGRRSGAWNGHKTYLLCAHCHNPHAPRFQSLEPEPPPVPPGETVGGSNR